ncbi:sarcosine oxidase delta subunit [alpha proteobacterium BAL199]|jgi:heterotetrameric sarcosine oxidase delta subunit|nr:sarcosine oxidase delta subunit [alpha proteobacterium BAL199]
MIRIPCPHCGPRDHDEFSYVGDATKVRPADPAATSPEDWHRYVYLRDNPRGAHLEYWHHIQGCRAYLKVLRDTATHEVLASGRPEDALEAPR